MIKHDLEKGFINNQLDSTTSLAYQSWINGFSTFRTQKLKQSLNKNKLEAREFVDITSLISQISEPQFQNAVRFLDIYKAYLPIKDLTNDRRYSIPILAVFSKGGGSSSDLAIPISIAEQYAIEHLFPDATSKIIGIADLTKTRLSTSLTAEQVAAVVNMYRVPNLYKQVTIHFLGLGFVNSILALVARISPDTKVISSKLLMANNMDAGTNVLADTINNLIRSTKAQ